MNNSSLKKAQKLHEKGHLRQAEEVYKRILKEDPKHIKTLHSLAALYAQSRCHNQALKTIHLALKINSKKASLLNSQGNIYYALGKIQKAIISYEAAIANAPNYSVVYNNLGRVFHFNQQFKKAKIYYKKAIELNPKFSDAYYNSAILWIQLGNYLKAINFLKKSLEINPKRPSAHGQLAELYRASKKYLDAIQHYQKRLETEPEHTDTIFVLGKTYIKNNQIEDAIAAFKKVLILDPKNTDVNQHLANAYLIKNEKYTAMHYYYRQLECNPLMQSYYNIGILLFQENRFREAMKYLEEACKIDPNYLPTHINLGALCLKLNRIFEAIKHYESAIRIKPDNQELQYILSALTKKGTPEFAPKEYLEHLFDEYAKYYDQHLTEILNYKGHQFLLNAVDAELNPKKNNKLTVIDLGCGTGLCGVLVKPLSKILIGIDVSSKMLDIARKKAIYDKLETQDISEALDKFKKNDLIVAGDVFSYVGKLDAIFQKSYQALNPGGLFAFTIEKTSTEPYELKQTIRYAHSKKYIKELAEKNYFKVRTFSNIQLRKQYKKIIEGYLVLLKK